MPRIAGANRPDRRIEHPTCLGRLAVCGPALFHALGGVRQADPPPFISFPHFLRSRRMAIVESLLFRNLTRLTVERWGQQT
jgi:hypothetical protein